MRLQPQQLGSHLQRGLAPVYLLCGDEPLQLGEAARAVRTEAQRQGFEERERLDVDAAFDWGRLTAAAQAMSLFCARKLIELHLESARIGREGSDAVREYCARPSPDNLLLILAPTLERKELQAKWVQELERAGVLLQVRPIEGERLVAWVEQRLRGRGLRPEPGVAGLLAERVEGNLLAAAQEVDKLALLYGEGELDAERLARAISDSARFDVFDLSDALLKGDRARAQRVLGVLAAEGTAPALVLWALTRELRMLAAASFASARGRGALAAAFEAHKVWESRRGLVMRAIERLPLSRLYDLVGWCATADRQIKGLEYGDPWLSLGRITDAMAGGA